MATSTGVNQVKSLAHLNSVLRHANMRAVRDPHGYYYFIGVKGTKMENLVSSGVYVFNCRHITLEDWLHEATEVVKEHTRGGVVA